MIERLGAPGGWVNRRRAPVAGQFAVVLRVGKRHGKLTHYSGYLIPTTIESFPTRCTTEVSRNPTSRIQPAQSVPV